MTKKLARSSSVSHAAARETKREKHDKDSIPSSKIDEEEDDDVQEVEAKSDVPVILHPALDQHSKKLNLICEESIQKSITDLATCLGLSKDEFDDALRAYIKELILLSGSPNDVQLKRRIVQECRDEVLTRDPLGDRW